MTLSRRFRAPADDGAALFAPPLAEAPEHLQRNVELNTARPLAAEARQELLQAARAYTAGYADVSFAAAASSAGRIILAGHQPELFHPGVWLKSFTLSALGRQLHATPINLIVDNDAVRSATIRVPTGAPDQPGVVQVPIDAPGEEIPWEERGIKDRALFATFGQRAQEIFESQRAASRLPKYTPILGEVWPRAVHSLPRQVAAANLGRTLAAARHAYEQQLGLRTLEVPLSSICQTRSFRKFLAQLLLELPRFERDYNSSLAEYRRANRLRSHSHPVPDLVPNADWYEAPCWIWTTASPRRRRLFARGNGASLELNDFAGVHFSIDIRGNGEMDCVADQLAEQERAGIKLRPRALLTTLFARLLLSDLFVHGIGGAKYDEVTDAIIRRFYGFEPPAYLTATATVRLPLDLPQVADADLRTLERAPRELRFHPERSVAEYSGPHAAELQTLARAKREVLAKQNLRGASRAAFEALDALNRRMFELLPAQHEALVLRGKRAAEQLRQAKLLGSREFSFALFPQETLPQLLLDLCAPQS